MSRLESEMPVLRLCVRMCVCVQVCKCVDGGERDNAKYHNGEILWPGEIGLLITWMMMMMMIDLP